MSGLEMLIYAVMVLAVLSLPFWPQRDRPWSSQPQHWLASSRRAWACSCCCSGGSDERAVGAAAVVERRRRLRAAGGAVAGAAVIMTAAAVLTLAASCQSVVAPTTILQIATRESGLDTAAVHVNADGSRDEGLMQINERNKSWLGLRDPFDPCQSIHAAGALLASYSRYNTGNPTKGIAYAQSVTARIGASDAAVTSAPKPLEPPSAVYAKPAHAGRELVYSH
jgi:hypothetical protein